MLAARPPCCRYEAREAHSLARSNPKTCIDRVSADVGVVRLHDTEAVRDSRMGTWMQVWAVSWPPIRTGVVVARFGTEPLGDSRARARGKVAMTDALVGAAIASLTHPAPSRLSCACTQDAMREKRAKQAGSQQEVSISQALGSDMTCAFASCSLSVCLRCSTR